ncbi:MAG: PEP-CTERM sorting domain-containing protein [Gloeobacterales cyanobacterium]
MMKFNALLRAVLSGITLSSTFLAGVLPATAVTLNYDLNGLFQGGGAFSGTFSADSVTQSLTDYSITTSPSGNLGATYASGTPGNSYSSAFPFDPSPPPLGSQTIFTQFPGGGKADNVLFLNFDSSIFAPPSSGVLNVSGSEIKCLGYPFCFGETTPRFVDSGTATLQPTQGIPEPLSIIGTLIGGGAVWRMRKKLNASTKVKAKK